MFEELLVNPLKGCNFLLVKVVVIFGVNCDAE
jgi:hypothetical protein